jgi:hypothetical protein
MVSSVNAALPVLPMGLRLKHGPILVTLERWSDGVVVARLPAARLEAEAERDADALDNLSELIADLVRDIAITHKGRPLGGAILRQWRALEALIDASQLETT